MTELEERVGDLARCLQRARDSVAPYLVMTDPEQVRHYYDRTGYFFDAIERDIEDLRDLHAAAVLQQARPDDADRKLASDLEAGTSLVCTSLKAAGVQVRTPETGVVEVALSLDTTAASELAELLVRASMKSRSAGS